MKMDAKFKVFFDRKAVIDQIGRQNARKLARAGAFLRTRARQKLRRRKKPSAPGQPPSVHSRDSFATLKNIRFGLNTVDESVIVGPVGFKRLQGSSAETVPELMEHGGTAMLIDRKTKKTTRVTIAARAFMGPTLNEEAPKIASFWR